MPFPELYSKRNRKPSPLRHDVPINARNRMLILLRKVAPAFHVQESVSAILSRVQQRLEERYGHFTPCRDRNLHPAVNHFLACTNAQALDFIEAIFTSMMNVAGAIGLVDDFNTVLRQEGIGYELTPMTQRTIKGGGKLLGHTVDTLDITYPIIRERGDTLQEKSMCECLDLLTDPDFKVANEQFLKAHQHYRAGEWDQAIAYCGSAFESVLKAVLDTKKIPYKKEAPASVLIKECVTSGIFPQVYENSLIGIANVRNAMSDTTHGRTSATQIVPDQKNAEHLLYVTAAHIVFITK